MLGFIYTYFVFFSSVSGGFMWIMENARETAIF